MPTVGKQSSLKRSGLPFAGRMTIARWLARKAMQFLDRVTDGIGRPWWLPVAVGALLFGLYDAGSAQSRKPSVTFIKFVGSKGIFGKDNRREPPSKYKDLTKSVGRLDTRIGQKLAMCTAFCVADSVVATAAHCLFIPDLGANFSNVSIAIGQGRDRRTTKIHGRTEWERQSSVIVGSPFQKERPDVAHDWALVRLGSPVCKDRALRLSTIDNIAAFYPKALEKDVFLLGYHTDLNPGLLRYSDDCLSSDAPFEAEAAHQLVKSIGQDSQDALPHRCDTFPGASGGPIFWDSPDGPSVVGVNSAVLHNLGLAGVPAEHRKLAEQINANAAILANAFEKQIQLIETTPTPVDRGELKLVQELLKETGHYNGQIDGLYGVKTRQAILDFERTYGRLADGRPTTRQRLANIRIEDAFKRYLADYVADHEFKALAFDPMSGRHGTGKGRTTLAKVIDQAVARCAEGGARNCRLYALGDTVVHDRSQRETDTIAAEYAHRVVGARVEGVFKFYLGDHDFKALAFDPMSGRHGTGQGQTTLAKAIDEAMARCAGGGTRSCQLYALGDSVVRDRSQREIDTIAAEYVQKVVRVRLEEAFKFYLGDHDFKALAFDPMSGRHSTGHGQTTPAKAVDEATARCAEGGAQSCELYAVGDIVVRGLPKEEVDAVIERYRQEVAAGSSETKH